MNSYVWYVTLAQSLGPLFEENPLFSVSYSTLSNMKLKTILVLTTDPPPLVGLETLAKFTFFKTLSGIPSSSVSSSDAKSYPPEFLGLVFLKILLLLTVSPDEARIYLSLEVSSIIVEIWPPWIFFQPLDCWLIGLRLAVFHPKPYFGYPLKILSLTIEEGLFGSSFWRIVTIFLFLVLRMFLRSESRLVCIFSITEFREELIWLLFSCCLISASSYSNCLRRWFCMLSCYSIWDFLGASLFTLTTTLFGTF